MNRPHFELKRKKKERPIDRVQSHFVKYTTTITACILICSVAFTFLVFSTNTIINVDANTVKEQVQEIRVHVSSVVAEINSTAQITTNPSIPGVTPTAPIVDGYYQYDENIYNKIMAANIDVMSDQVAKYLASLYLFIKDDYGLIAIAGLAGNVCHEGTPGQLQSDEPHDDFNGPGTGTVISRDEAPIYMLNDYNIWHLENDSEFGGVGVFQFTYKPYREQIAAYYRKYKKDGIDLTQDDCRAAETEYTVVDILPQHAGIKDCTSPEEAATWWLVNYEQNGQGYVEKRCVTAKQVYEAITGGN